jgi:Fur family transcriptional regulator, ferric uptake regulator
LPLVADQVEPRISGQTAPEPGDKANILTSNAQSACLDGYNGHVTLLEPAQGLVNELRDQGFKITTPRFQVIETVAGREDNFTAEELAAELASIGRATVYRTLKLLLDHGLVCRVVMNDGSVAYRVSHKAHHHHLVCVSCGATEDVHLTDVEDVLAKVREATEYDVVGHRIEVYGICPRCRLHQGASPTVDLQV